MSTILGNAYVRIRPDTTGFKSETDGLVGKALGGLTDVAKKAGLALGGVLTVAGGIGIKTAAQMETARIGFTTMLGSAQKADDFLKKLAKFAADTPFEFPELQTAASSLISIGIDASKVIPIMTTLGNVTSGMGTGAEGVKRATVALQQMNAAGRISAQDLNQLRDAGIPVFDLLTAATGKTKEQISEMAQSGKLGRQELEQLMAALESGKGLERFNGLMEKQSQSLSGLFSTLKDTVQMNLARTMEPLIPAIKSAMEKAAPLLDQGLGAIQQKFEAFSKKLPTLVTGLKDFFSGGDFTGMAAQLGVPVEVIHALENVRDIVANLIQIARNSGPVLGVALGGSLRLVWEITKLLLPVIEGLTHWLSENQWAVYGLVGAYAALKLAMLAHKAAMAWQSGAMATSIINSKAIVAATKAWTAVQWLLNAAMRANPIGIVITILAALVGAVVLAYQKSEKFRDIVQGVFRAVGTAASWVWNSVLKPVFEALKTAWDATVTGMKWAWEHILKPVFDVLGKVIQGVAIFLMVVVFGPLMLAWKVLTEAFKLAWEYVLKPVFEAIATVAQWLWNNILKPVFGFIAAYFQAQVTIMKWAWENILKPAWDAISAAITWLWNNVLKPIFGFIGDSWNRLLTAIQWAWNNVLKPTWDAISAAAKWLYERVLQPIFGAIKTAWDGLASAFSWVWNNLIRPVFDAFSKVVETVKNGFGTAVDWIKRTWESLKNALMTPVQWVIDFVWNNGLRKLWNTINNLWGGNDLEPFKLATGGVIERSNFIGRQALATGGVLPGYTPGRDVHRFFSPTGGLLDLSGGEAVMRPEFTKAMGLHGVNMLNAAARKGGVRGVAAALAAQTGLSQSHAKGGVIDLPGWLKLPLKLLPGGGLVSNVIDQINNGDGFGGGFWGDALLGTVKKVGTSLWDAAKKLFGELTGGFFGGSKSSPNGVGGLGPMAAAARQFVMSQWGITNIGGYANRNIAGTGVKSDHALGKAIDIMIPNYRNNRALGSQIANWFVGNPGRFGTKYVIYWDQINEGRGWKPYSHPGGGSNDTLQHRDHVHVSLFDDGGVLPPGLTLANNKSRKPEAVFTNDEWQVIKAIATGGGGAAPLVGGDLILRVDPNDDVRDQIESAMFELRRIKRGGGVR